MKCGTAILSNSCPKERVSDVTEIAWLLPRATANSKLWPAPLHAGHLCRGRLSTHRWLYRIGNRNVTLIAKCAEFAASAHANRVRRVIQVSSVCASKDSTRGMTKRLQQSMCPALQDVGTLIVRFSRRIAPAQSLAPRIWLLLQEVRELPKGQIIDQWDLKPSTVETLAALLRFLRDSNMPYPTGLCRRT